MIMVDESLPAILVWTLGWWGYVISVLLNLGV